MNMKKALLTTLVSAGLLASAGASYRLVRIRQAGEIRRS
ncbi:hypothetical protein SAMN05421724_3870 [Pseudomonas syringae]|nr:hypothetical protein SAMN05421724_3870 [Pseudomonas syringae]